MGRAGGAEGEMDEKVGFLDADRVDSPSNEAVWSISLLPDIIGEGTDAAIVTEATCCCSEIVLAVMSMFAWASAVMMVVKYCRWRDTAWADMAAWDGAAEAGEVLPAGKQHDAP